MDRRFVFFAVSFALSLFIIQSMPDYILANMLVLVLGALLSGILFFRNKKPQSGFAILGCITAMIILLVLPIVDKSPEFVDESVGFYATAIGYSYENNNGSGVVCDLEVTHLSKPTPIKKFKTRMYFNDRNISLTPGDQINGLATFRVPENNKDFKAFTYYKTRGIDAVSFCSSPLTAHKQGEIVLRFIPQWLAHEISVKISELFSTRAAGFITAMLIGDKNDFALSDNNNFTAIGLSHVVAVSGMHLSILAGFIVALLGRRKTVFIILPVLVLFTIVVGAPLSVVRALIMQTIYLLSVTFKGESDGINSLSIALVFILLFNPYSALDIGLQLSFMATFGIIVLGKRINAFLIKRFSFKRKVVNDIVNFFASLFSTSLAAILFTTPLSAIYFGTVSIVAPLSNLLLLGIINFVFVASIVVVAIGCIFFPLAKLLAIPLSLLSAFILDASAFIADMPLASIHIEYTLQWIIFIYLYAVIYLFVIDKNKKIIIPSICVFCVMMVFLVTYLNPTETKEYDGIRFAILDVGQGSTMVADRHGTTVMVDCGGDRAINSGKIAAEYLRKIKCTSVDALILTHFDYDHINGVTTLMENVKISEIYIPRAAFYKDAISQSIITAAKQKGIKVITVDDGMDVTIKEIKFNVYPSGWFDSSNDQSLAVVFSKDDFNLVVTGDMGKATELQLCENYTLPDAEVYVVGHHGSDTSSSLKFLNTIRPELAIISVGKDNSYDLPSDSVISLLEKMNINIARTDIDGNIIFYSDEIMKGAS